MRPHHAKLITRQDSFCGYLGAQDFTFHGFEAGGHRGSVVCRFHVTEPAQPGYGEAGSKYQQQHPDQ